MNPSWLLNDFSKWAKEVIGKKKKEEVRQGERQEIQRTLETGKRKENTKWNEMLKKRWNISKEKMTKKPEGRERAQVALKDIC